MKKFITLFFLFVSVSAYAATDILTKCVENIYQDQEAWHDKIANIFSNEDDLSQAAVTKNKNKLYNLLAQNLLKICPADVLEIFNEKEGKINFEYNDKLYALEFNPKELQKYLNIETGILVINNTQLSPGDILTKSQTPKDTKFFSAACSPHSIWYNLDDDAAVNKAGQAAFNDKTNEFFLDFARGDNMRAFPGLVLMDITGSTQEKIVTFPNLAAGKNATSLFTEKLLKNTNCNNQGLAVYTVALKVAPDTSTDKRILAVAASSGYAIATGTTLGIISGAILGVAALGVATYSLYPEELRQIDQVMIVDGPHILHDN